MREPKTVTAFRWTCESLFERSPRVYFWTMTMRETMPAWHFPPMWNDFSAALVRKLGRFKGVRVFHWHRDHGLHVHFLCNLRIPVHLVRRMGKRYGFGIVDVRLADAKAPIYLGRYLGKDILKMPHGGRSWARFGGTQFGTRVRDIREESERASYIRLRVMELRPFTTQFRAMRQAGAEYDTRLAREWLEDERNSEMLQRAERLFVLEDESPKFPRWKVERRDREFGMIGDRPGRVVVAG